jgi:alanine racemase
MPEELADLVKHTLSPLVSDGTYIDALAKTARAAGQRLDLHLKIDTGMGRAGCRPEEAAALAAQILSHKNLRLAGLATHLAVSDSASPGDRAYTGEQLQRFASAVTAVRAAGIDPGIIHAANTGGVFYHPDSWFDMVRPGILLYGYGPRPGTAAPPELPAIIPRPVMELHSKIAAIKPIRRGETVSYGRTWTAAEDTLVALIPAGYADGLRRDLGGAWHIAIRGSAYPIVGRICMDQCMVNLGSPGHSPPPSPGDNVILFGEAPTPCTPPPPGAPQCGDAALMAESLGTIPYEITCGISKRVPRVYVDHP